MCEVYYSLAWKLETICPAINIVFLMNMSRFDA